MMQVFFCKSISWTPSPLLSKFNPEVGQIQMVSQEMAMCFNYQAILRRFSMLYSQEMKWSRK